MFAFESDTFDSDTLGSSPMCGLLLVSVQTFGTVLLFAWIRKYPSSGYVSTLREVGSFQQLLLSSLVEAKYKIFKEGSNTSEGTLWKRTKQQWCHFIGKSSSWWSVSANDSDSESRCAKLAQLLAHTPPIPGLVLHDLFKDQRTATSQEQILKANSHRRLQNQLDTIGCHMEVQLFRTNICHQKAGNVTWHAWEILHFHDLRLAEPSFTGFSHIFPAISQLYPSYIPPCFIISLQISGISQQKMPGSPFSARFSPMFASAKSSESAQRLVPSSWSVSKPSSCFDTSRAKTDKLRSPRGVQTKNRRWKFVNRKIKTNKQKKRDFGKMPRYFDENYETHSDDDVYNYRILSKFIVYWLWWLW